MSSYRLSKRQILVAVMALSLIPTPTFSSNISNVVNPGDIGHINGDSVINGVNGGKIYNINPSAINGSIGFRHYKNFNLSEGDIANLIFKYGRENVEKFVNFVDNTININGLLNTMRDNNFYNGHAIFISPNGLVVGASGVLNVGSLSVLTPSKTSYEEFSGNMDKYAPILAKEGTSEYNALMDNKGTGTIKIDGKVLARNSINLRAADVDFGSTARVLAGVNNNELINTNARAEALFATLVNTGNRLNTTYGNDSGSIRVVSYGANGGISADDASAILNYGKGDSYFESTGLNGVIANGLISNNTGNVTVKSAHGIDVNGKIENLKGDMLIENTTSNGININYKDAAKDNTIFNGGKLTMNNAGEKGINVKGKVLANGVDINNKNSNVVIGDKTNPAKDTVNNRYITSNGDINIDINNGSLLNAGVKDTLMNVNNGNLNIDVKDGTIGLEVGPCDGGVCTGIGPNGRDLTKSVNANVDGTYTAKTTKVNSKDDLVINMAALNSDMNVNEINADGRVILLADSSTKGSKAYDILNAKESDKAPVPNIQGKGISLIASGNIGAKDKKVTFRQNGAESVFYGDDARKPHVNTDINNNGYGVDMLAIGDINIKGMDAENGKKVNTNVCSMISRTGDVNAEFSGDTYIDEITAKNNIDITTRGKTYTSRTWVKFRNIRKITTDRTEISLRKKLN